MLRIPISGFITITKKTNLIHIQMPLLTYWKDVKIVKSPYPNTFPEVPDGIYLEYKDSKKITTILK